MSKIFISQPMNGRSEIDILKERERIYIDWLDLLYYGKFDELIDSYTKTNVPYGAGRLWYLGDDIQKMADADIVILAPGWEKAAGCCVEFEVAKRYGITTYKYDGKDFIPIILTGNKEKSE